MVAIIVYVVRLNFFANFLEALQKDSLFFLVKVMEEALIELFYESESSDKIWGFTDTNLESDWERAMARASTIFVYQSRHER